MFVYFLLVFTGTHNLTFKNLKSYLAQKKWWVIWHPFKAKKALEISIDTKRVSDSIRKTNLLDGDYAGGQIDAFRHAYWMARLRIEIGKMPLKV